jgi:hypothetical protein
MNTPCLRLAVLCGLGWSAAACAQAPTPAVTVEPAKVTLTHSDDAQRLLVTVQATDGPRDATHAAEYTSADPAIAVVSAQGVVRPVAAGQTTVRVKAGDQTATAAVVVTDAKRRPVSFALDVMPILAKAGCNSGACHGSASGKKGFKVSLRGYDPAADYVTLTRGTTGRRIDENDPARSLLVLKPTGQVPHEGSVRFAPDSVYARTLQRWIAEGAASDLAAAPQLVGLDVAPAFRTYTRPGGEQQLLVRACYSDGAVRDVTGDARYSSNNEGAAEAGEDGMVKLKAKGEAALMVRYGSQIAVSTLVVLKHDPAFVWTDPPENNYIDHLVNAKLKPIEVEPSDLTTDPEFLRRVCYDVIGLPPTAAEVRDFLADARPDKRARKIDELLERPEHAEFWALQWGDLLRMRFEVMRDKGTWGLYRWLRDSVAANKPFDQFVREIITADGSCDENPAANFWRAFATPEEAGEATAQVFLGMRLLCARCHDHPFEKWVQKDYYGLSAFYSQVGRKPGAHADDVVIFRTEAAAQARHPVTGEMLSPKYLDGASLPVGPDQDARQLLADWLTRKDNPFLARATVNRLWSRLFGRGIIDPVDDIRSSNPPANGPLLDALTRDFADHNFDVRHILRTMLNSRVYQLSARTNPSNHDDREEFSHALPRRLTAEQLLDTLGQITGVRENFRARYAATGSVSLPNGGVRAGQLPDRGMTADLLDLFGRPRGESSCACERHDEASMTQALHLINGQDIAARLADPNGRLGKLAQTANLSDDQLTDELYFAVLCRPPTPAERDRIREHFASAKNRFEAAQDVTWVLLNTKEFLFNH